MLRVICILAFVAVLGCRETTANERDSFYLVQTDNKLVAVIKYRDENGVHKCRIFTDPTVVEGVKKITSEDKIHQVSEDEMEKLWAECDALENVRMEGTLAKEESRGWDMIFPGTKWCGAGNISKDYEDLGEEADTDRCCRAHDMCNDIMDAGETKNNLTNNSPFTSLSCKCDNEFYDCLQKIDSMTSNAVGYSYFTFLRRQCYEKDHPFTDKCTRYWTIMQLSCLEYEKDTSKPPVYQWVPAKYFK